MSPKKRPRLSAVQPLADFRLALTFTEGQQMIVDLIQGLESYPGLKPLLDPEVFGAAIIGVDGWSVESGSGYSDRRRHLVSGCARAVR